MQEVVKFCIKGASVNEVSKILSPEGWQQVSIEKQADYILQQRGGASEIRTLLPPKTGDTTVLLLRQRLCLRPGVFIW